jgi:hypothetical protein
VHQINSGFSRRDRECFSAALRYARSYALQRWRAGADADHRRSWEKAYLTFKDHFRLIVTAQETPACNARHTLPQGERCAFLGLVFVTEARVGRIAVESLSKVLEPTREPLATLLDKQESYWKVLNALKSMRAK